MAVFGFAQVQAYSCRDINNRGDGFFRTSAFIFLISNAPLCQIYPLLFRSQSENIGHNDKADNSDHIVQVLFSAHSAEAAIYVLTTIQQHGTSSQLINLGNGSKKLCTRSATQILQESNSKNNKTKCEPVRPGIAKAFNEDDEELMLNDQSDLACFV